MIYQFLSSSLIIISSIDNRVTNHCQIKSPSSAVFTNSSNLNAVKNTCYTVLARFADTQRFADIFGDLLK